MSNRQYRKPIPELQGFIDKKGRNYITLLAFKMKVSARTIIRWYKQQSAPSPAEKEKLLKIIKGYN